jgi:hypothetical protein
MGTEVFMEKDGDVHRVSDDLREMAERHREVIREVEDHFIRPDLIHLMAIYLHAL